MENENDSELGELLFECSKDFSFLLVFITKGLIFLVSSYVALQSAQIIFDSRSWTMKINGFPFILTGFLAPIFGFFAYRLILDLIDVLHSELSIYENALLINKSEKIYFSNIVDAKKVSYGTKSKQTYFVFQLKDHSEKIIYVDIWNNLQDLLEIIKRQVDVHKESSI